MNYHLVAQDAPRIFRHTRLRPGPVDDAAELIDLVAACSEESRFMRFHTGMAELRPAMAEKLVSLAAERGRAIGLRTWRGRLVADARYTRITEREAEVAILVADKYQGRGLGKALLAVLFEAAEQDGIEALHAEVLGSNDAILHVLGSLAPMETTGFENGSRQVRMPLEVTVAAA